MHVHRVLVFAAISIGFWVSNAHGAVTAWTDVIVRVYDTSGVTDGTNRAALDEARKTLEAASVDVIWRPCAHPGSRCDAPMKPGGLAIRIVRSRAPASRRGTLPLGNAMIDTSTGTGALATIYFDHVQWLAEATGTDVRTLLGRAIAHELGHLLLATSAHGPVGLMRALWSQDEIRRGHAQDWRFAPTEIAAIRLRTHARHLAAASAWGTR
jgi:hypothetical protein